MSDYTPTTEEVRDAFSWRDGVGGQSYEADFDRWLTEVKAQAWEKGYTQGNNDMYNGDYPTPNPYRQQTQ